MILDVQRSAGHSLELGEDNSPGAAGDPLEVTIGRSL